MSIKRKALLIQASFGAIILTILMQPMIALGYGNYTWMLFVVMLLFFALGAQFKVLPSMIVGYICGVAWALLNGFLMGTMHNLPPWVSSIALTIVIIFCILTLHENILRDTLFGNVPSLFLGLAETFFIFSIEPSNAIHLTPVHLFVIFLYGLLMTSALVLGGGLLCNVIIGKDWPKYVYGDGEAHAE